MNNDGAGSAERRSAAFSIFEKSLEDYVKEVVASYYGPKTNNAPERLSDSIQNSIKASEQYHDFMSGAHRQLGHDSYDAYYREMADSYRALRT